MKLIISILIVFLIYKVFEYLLTSPVSSSKKDYSKPENVDDIMIKDPVCEVYFPKKDGIHLDFGGKDMYFCSPECRDKFVALNSNK